MAEAATQEASDTELSGSDLIEATAHEMGWSPKDKWKGDPDKWRDASTFLKATPQVLKSMREQLERSTRAASQTIERIQREAVAKAEERIETARAAGDADAVAEAAKELKEASRPVPQEVTDFAARNGWYQTDRAATVVAIEAAEKVANTGGTVAAQLEAAEKEVRKRFPELFGDEAPADTSARREPPAVQGGQRTANSAPRKRGWSDIPAAARAVMTPKILKSFNQTEAEYAEAYWQENG